MKKSLLIVTLAVLSLFVQTANAEEKKRKALADWLEITSSPEKVKIGGIVTIKLKVKGVADGQFIGGDMHFFRGPSYGGFLQWAKPQKIEAGKEYTFTYKVGKKTDMTGVAILFYVGPKPSYGNKTKEVWLKGIEVE